MTKSVVITDGLTVDGSDPDADTTWGHAPPNTLDKVQVSCQPFRGSVCGRRFVVSDASENWFTGFSAPGPRPEERDIADITLQTPISARGFDNDNGLTAFFWGSPYASATIAALPGQGRVHAFGWPLGATLTVTVTSPNGQTVTVSGVVVEDPSNPGGTLIFTFRVTTYALAENEVN